MSHKPNVLLIEDNAPQARLYQQYLANEKIALSLIDNGKAAKELILSQSPELILLDLKLPDMDGREILQWLQSEQISCSVIVITAHSTVDIAVDVMRLGAEDFLEKPFGADRLRITIQNMLNRRRLQHQVEGYQAKFERKSYHGFIGSSLPMQAVYRIIDAVAASKATVFITGQSGTGKEVCAEAIHHQGSRANKPFVALNCGAIPHDLMESEIFGHVKGAFTGAVSDRKGAAAHAEGGTLFLDEICEMSLDLQTKLLRFIQNSSFQKVGSSVEEKADLRFICATNKDPLEAVAAGKFREDLYYRLHVVPLHLPPLGERGDDIIEIALFFLNSYAKEEGKDFIDFSPETEVILRSYHWPGNVRQLQNVIRNIVVLHNEKSVAKIHLPSPLNAPLQILQSTPLGQEAHNNHSAQGHSNELAVDACQGTIKSLAEVERDAIERAIRFCDDNIPKAAALLNVSPSTIYRKKQGWDESIPAEDNNIS
ncbi:sigma-54-dependent Fis family transcriptional regulator [Gammaproteobacteria bacterium 53_120_T64]|nr:sigma-54-dependent Fis family transcriptional regulator [Gammaproteobacteria bacterium 53_120_T64]